MYLRLFGLIKKKALMIKINVILKNVNWRKHLKNPHSFIDRKIEKINKKNKLYKKKILICSLLLSGTEDIKKLNKKFRKKNKSTDILSFPFYKKKHLSKRIKRDKETYLGDIIINLEEININKKLKFEHEFNKLWIHGLVHLFGYEHKKDNDFYIMNKIEKKYLKYVN